MPTSPRVIDRIQDQSDFTGSLTNGAFLTYSSGTGKFSLAAVSVPVGANPSASVGLTAVNGSAATFLRSDGAPALSQAITPTWTGLHTYNVAPVIGGTTFAGGGITNPTTAFSIAVKLNGVYSFDASYDGVGYPLNIGANGAVSGSVSPSPALSFGTNGHFASVIMVSTSFADNKGLIITGVSSQAATLFQLQGRSSTTAREQADIDTAWNAIDGAAGTDATRSADLILRAWSVVTAQEGIRIRAAAAGVRLGLFGHSPAAQDAGWSTANSTPTRSLNVSTATLGDVANVLATLLGVHLGNGYIGA